MSRLLSADTVRRRVARDNKGKTYADLSREFGLSDEFVRLVLTGGREPSKAFLAVTGYERVVLYRKKASRHDHPDSSTIGG